MRILIVGGGIGGVAAARTLLDAGHEVTVLERSPELRTLGGAITLWHAGTTILDDLGVDLSGAGGRLTSVEARTASGRPVMTMDLRRLDATFGSHALVIPRATLLRALADGLPDEVFQFNARFTGLEELADGIRVHTEDGGVHDADLLIGADGVGSAVRAAVFGPEPKPLTGVASWQGLIPTPVDLGGTALMMMGAKGYLGLSPAGDGLAQWFCDTPWPAPDGDPLAMLAERYGDWAPPVPELFAALSHVDVRAYPHHRRRIPRFWGRGRTILLGDSAHAMPPSLALGANQALEDVWVLRRALDASPATALREYSVRRRGRASFAAAVATRSMAVRGPQAFFQREAMMRGAGTLPSGVFERALIGMKRRISNRLGDVAVRHPGPAAITVPPTE
ncbi:NAD(P)/FAD-dependent oxidoreductase [Phytomonospora sp. NPDC050363]|uniref:FAD-dependent oxidoreductase n=1 Tax=Phytomonospora sp. NPDC050363 TaxID=3155642 RepID=UPI0033D6AC46